jgi:3-oxoacyl-[acyl-carrier-protein] synthase-3
VVYSSGGMGDFPHKQKPVRSVGVVGTGFYVPEKVLTNFDLEEMVDTSDEWIYSHTGIKERRIADNSEATSDLAFRAAREAIQNAKVRRDEIDLIIVATQTPDRIIPATASIVQEKLGAKNAAAFDINVACSGFVYALCIGASFVKEGISKNALIIGAETMSRIIDWTDRTTCIFFGDGAGAVVLSQVPDTKGILSSYLMTDGTGKDVIQIPAGGSRLPASAETVRQRQHFVKMDNHTVWNFATNAFPLAVLAALEKCGLKAMDIDFLISHQANARIIKIGMDKLGLPIEKTWVNLDRYGNTSGASIPIALAEAVAKGKIKEDDIAVFVAFGTGLAWGAIVMRWYGRREVAIAS